MSKNKAILEQVKSLLESKPRYRDDDALLVSDIWWRELFFMNINPDKISATEFMRLMIAKKLTPASVIERSRRRIMETNPLLRGKSYKPRKRKAVGYKQENLV